MELRPGSFIAVEGVNARASVSSLARRLKNLNYTVLELQFPQTDKGSGYFAKQYLSGAYGDVGPYANTLFFGLDWFDSIEQINGALEQGTVVLVSGFVGRVMAEQGAFFEHSEQRRGFFVWLDNVAFELLKLPRPDKTIVTKSTNNVTATEAYIDLCQLFPKDFTLLDFGRSSKALSKSEYGSQIFKLIEPLLPVQPSSKKQESKVSTIPIDLHYEIPKALTGDVKTHYQTGLDKLIKLHKQLLRQLQGQSKKLSEEAANKLVKTASATLPIATVDAELIKESSNHLTELLDKELTTSGDLQPQPLALISWTPRNELDSLSDLLYSETNLSQAQLIKQLGDWVYEKKAKLFSQSLSLLSSKPLTNSILQDIVYRFDVVSDYATYLRFRSYDLGKMPSHQLLTARYGYNTPEEVETSGSAVLFENCFDLSLELFSSLQAKGFWQEAQLVTLTGHKNRWQLTITLSELIKLSLRLDADPLIDELIEAIKDVHPLTYETFVNTLPKKA